MATLPLSCNITIEGIISKLFISALASSSHTLLKYDRPEFERSAVYDVRVMSCTANFDRKSVEFTETLPRAQV